MNPVIYFPESCDMHCEVPIEVWTGVHVVGAIEH